MVDEPTGAFRKVFERDPENPDLFRQKQPPEPEQPEPERIDPPIPPLKTRDPDAPEQAELEAGLVRPGLPGDFVEQTLAAVRKDESRKSADEQVRALLRDAGWPEDARWELKALGGIGEGWELRVFDRAWEEGAEPFLIRLDDAGRPTTPVWPASAPKAAEREGWLEHDFVQAEEGGCAICGAPNANHKKVAEPEPEQASGEVVRYADAAMFQAAEVPEEALKAPKVHILSITPDPLGSIAAMCRMYEGKPTYDLHDVTDEERRHYWEQANATHLKAPLEAVDIHFFIEGVDRGFTHQMVRQRTAVFAQESMRFAVKDDLGRAVRPPLSVAEGGSDRGEVYAKAIETIAEAYNWLIADGVPAEEARGLLPHDTLTRLNYKTNLRNLLDHAGNRLCTQAQFIWRSVFLQIVQGIRDFAEGCERDWQFKLIASSAVFKPVCFQIGHCPFQASFDRPCSIRDRVQAGDFDQIHPAEWMADPAAARRSS